MRYGIYLTVVNEVVIPKPIKSCIFYEGNLQLAEMEMLYTN